MTMNEMNGRQLENAGSNHPWHAMESDDVGERLETSAEGLPADEAARRLEQYGLNEVEVEKPLARWKIALHQLQDPLIYILLIAAAVTLALRHMTDTGVILAVVVINGVIGFIQEIRAQKAMLALQRLSAPRANVIRDGEASEIASRELVPGDLVLLTSGDRVPADIRITSAQELELDESALTGESLPVQKKEARLGEEIAVPADQINIAFAGTVVTRGRGRGWVVRTGSATELGQIAVAVRRVGTTATPLQQKFDRFGHQIALVIALLSVLVLFIGLLRAMPASEIFVTTVALAVASIPEGLPVVLTVTLAIAVSRMAKRNAIIRSLPAVETLGSTTVIGSDKTGTLTRNEMTVRAVWSGGELFDVLGSGYGLEGGFEKEGTPVDLREAPALIKGLTIGMLANETDPSTISSERPVGDPTELALLVAGTKAGLQGRSLAAEHRELAMLPFESERRFMASLRQTLEGEVLYVKGAPEAIVSRCTLQLDSSGEEEPLDVAAVREAAEGMAGRGLRVLAMAFKRTAARAIDEEELTGGFVFAGLQGLEDPVRPEAIDAVAKAHQAGIRVLMITGDHLATARAIGEQLGLDRGGPGKAVEGSELELMNDAELDAVLREANVFARVAPVHKLRIVDRLKANGEIVAVTGDGVNDGPALRSAHLGIAMGKGGTEVAREASAMVLSDDNFATITAAIEEGRVVFANIRKVTFFLLSTGVGQVLTILIALSVGWPLPFLAAQILWINLVTNGLQDVALAFEPGEKDVLSRPPRRVGEGIITLRLLERLGGVGALIAAGTLFVFWWTLRETGDLVVAQSVAMTQMVAFQFFHVFNSRSLDRSILSIPLLSNPFLFASVIAAALAHAAVLHWGPLQTIFRTVPLTAEQLGMILLVGSSVIVGGELDKWRNRRIGRPIG
jgi:magnesium-transporting ATPase (P-type)